MEQELKYRLPDQAAWERVAAALGPEQGSAEQVNHYLDTEDGQLSRSKAAMLRVRQESGENVVTLKLGVKHEDGYFQAEELEVNVSEEVAAELRAGRTPASVLDTEPFQRLEQTFGTTRLACKGSMKNFRRSFPLPGGDVAELDRTSFPDGSTDYELEVETEDPDRVRAFLREVFELAGIPLVAQEETKFRRFLERSR